MPNEPAPTARASRELAVLGAWAFLGALSTLRAARGGATPLDHAAEPRAALWVAFELALVWAAYFVGARAVEVRTREELASLLMEGSHLRVFLRHGTLALAPLALLLSSHALVVVPTAAILLGLWHALFWRTVVRVGLDARWSRARRGIALALAVPLVLPPLVLASWGVFSSLLQSGLSRLVHLQPPVREHERALVIEAPDGLRLDATLTELASAHEATGVLLVHGFADGPSQLAPFAARLEEQGLPSLRVTLRAHGTSSGTLVTFTHRERMDVIAGAHELLRARGVRRDCFAAIGVSMGGATLLAASDTLVELGLGALVVLAPPSDFSAIVSRALPPIEPFRWLASSEIDVVSRALGAPSPLSTVPRRALASAPELPVLVFHSRVDHTVPYVQSEALRETHAPTTLVTIADVSHGRTPEEVLAHHFDRVLEAVHAACPTSPR
ncbi:MAG: hypothetical protein K1X94_24165 [Sandaracinaceae bacterium]|nr:hypothetical protein [Sandaracinaceae bacterium]